MAKITITFNEDFVEDYRLGYTYALIDVPNVEHTAFWWQNTVSQEMQVLVASPTSNVGEATAINFVTALQNNMPTQQAQEITVTRIVNVVVIETAVNNRAFSNLWAYECMYPCEDVASVGFVIDNSYSEDTSVASQPELKQIQIDIIDTQENERVLILEKTQMYKPKLIWLGSDDIYQTLMTSKLEFNMLVEDAEDAHFLHLFSVNDNRYKVVLSDVYDEDNPIIIWQGFLLPEQFSEPYERASLFVEFVAVDGVGLLKNKYLPNDFYGKKKTISKILSECLKLTGSELELWYSKSIENKIITDLTISDFEIETYSFLNGENKKSAYSILESVVLLLGCKLVQYHNRWFLIGLNIYEDVVIGCDVFDCDGVFIGKKEYSKYVLNGVFESTPVIDIEPSLRKVEIIYDKDVNANIFSVVNGKPLMSMVNRYGNVVIEDFELVGGDQNFEMAIACEYKVGDYTLIKYTNNGDLIDFNGYEDYLKSMNLTRGLFHLAVYKGHSDVQNHYIKIAKPVYFKNEYEYGDAKFTFEIEFVALRGSSSDDEAGFNNAFTYELYYNDTLILTNNSSENNYKTSYLSSSLSYVSGVVKVEDISVTGSGYFYLKLKTKNVWNGVPFYYGYFKNISLKGGLGGKNVFISKERDNLNSLNREVNLNYEFSKQIRDFRNVLVADDYSFSSAFNTVPELVKKINVYNFGTHTNGSDCYAYFNITLEDYVLCKKHFNFLAKKVNGSGELIPLSNISLHTGSLSTYELNIKISSNPCEFSSSDEIWINVPSSQELISNKNELLGFWKSSKNDSLGFSYFEILARIYHDISYTNKFKVMGNLFGLVFPLNNILFNFKGDKIFVPIDLSLDLTDGMTNLVMIENKQENVEDYVS